MRLTRTGVCLLAAFGLTVVVNGQAAVPQPPLQLSENQHLHGPIKIESLAAGRTRIELWLNTPTWLAKGVVLEAGTFTIRQEATGAVLIESAGPVRVTGFTLGQSIITNRVTLRDAPGSVLTWDQGFQLRSLADGTLEWGCCPRKE
jgi:hypothetical protein